MILGFNLMGFVITVLPPFFYAWVIFLTSPNKSLSLKKIPSFIIGGAFSVVVLKLLNFLVPYNLPGGVIDSFDYNFYYIAPREELAKFIAFILFSKILSYKKTISPISIMYYFGLIGLGFALIENIYYITQHGMWVMKFRLLGATLVHMICGFIFGYWLGMGKITSNQNRLSSFLINLPRVKYAIYAFFGFIFSVTFHGIWNHSIDTFQIASSPILVLLIFNGLLLCKFLSSDLYSKQGLEGVLDSSEYLGEEI